jgi:heme exporter protein B
LSSSWHKEILAVLSKEWKTESRSRSGLFASFLFAFLAVVTVAFSTFQEKLSAGLASGLLWVILLFSSIVSLSRSFVSEEEAGTSALLKLVSRPHAVFWGKALYNLIQMLITAAVIVLLLLVLANLALRDIWLFALALLGGCASMAGAVTLCGALVAQAANRSALVGVLGLPLLLPLVAMGVGASSYCLGAGRANQAVAAALGLCIYAAAMFAVGPWLFSAVWKE